MTEMQLLMTDASRKGLVSPQVLKEALELLKPGGKSKFIQAVRALFSLLKPCVIVSLGCRVQAFPATTTTTSFAGTCVDCCRGCCRRN